MPADQGIKLSFFELSLIHQIMIAFRVKTLSSFSYLFFKQDKIYENFHDVPR